MANTKLPARLLDTSTVPALNVTGATFTGTIRLDTGATTGSRTIKDDYSSGALANQGFLRSSGGNYWGYSTYQDGSANWKSAVSVASERSVFAIDEDQAYWSHAPSQTVSIGSDLTTQPTKKIVFDLENAKVGIGTDTPNSPLHVKSSGTGNVLYVESSDGQHLGGFYQEADTRAAFNIRSATGNVEINLDSGGSSWFTGGKLGVGTAAPNLKLHVEEDTDTWAGEFKNVRSAGGYGLRIDNSGAGGASDTRYALGVYTPGGTGFFVRNDSTVVLGATVPDGQFHIKGATNKTLKIDGTHSSGEFTSVSFARNGTDKWRIFQKADDSRLSFYSDGASSHQLSLHSDGNVTKPKNCAFRAYTQTEWTTNGEITSGWNDTAFSSDGRCYDVNSNFNPSNGRFTAPVAGIYLFTVMWDSNGSQGGLTMMKNSTAVTLVAWEPTGRSDDAWESKAYSTMVQLAKNDYITLKAVHASGSYPVHMGNAQWGHFSGCLIS